VTRNGQPDPTRTPTSAYAYTGREWDSETQLQYNRNRWYNPNLGRWLSQDPIGFRAGDPNLYRYVGNNTVNSTDPSGLQPSGQLGHWYIDKCFRDAAIYWTEFFFGGHFNRDEYVPPNKIGGGGALGGAVSHLTLDLVPTEAPWNAATTDGDRFGTVVATTCGIVALRSYSRVDAVAFSQTVFTDLVTVSRWGRPGLQTGDWVMRGPKSYWTYARSGKWESKWTLNFSNTPASYACGQEFVVPCSTLRWPRGWNRFRGAFGQRIYIGPGLD
jgi:RHS repeat-associated protein